jgi:hypothetical protein
MSDFDIYEFIKKINEEIKNDSENKEALSFFRKIFNTLPENQLDAINYFIKTMPKSDDITLIVIKGHLLLEEQLRNLFKSNFNNPKVLNKSKFEFSQIITMVEAIFENDERNNNFWESIRKLNTIRNDIAHNIENKGLNDKVNNLIKISNKILSLKIEDTETIENKLKLCITGLAAHLISLATHAIESRKAKDKWKYFAKQYNNDYASFDNAFNKIFIDDEIDNEKDELTLFKKSFNNTYIKLTHLLDITNNEYIFSTYGAYLAAKERKELLSNNELEESILELKSQHHNVMKELDIHFKNEYDKLILESVNELKNTLDLCLEKIKIN